MEAFSAQGVRSLHGGTESAGTTRIPELLPGFRKAPVPGPLSPNRFPAQVRPTKKISDPDRRKDKCLIMSRHGGGAPPESRWIHPALAPGYRPMEKRAKSPTRLGEEPQKI